MGCPSSPDTGWDPKNTPSCLVTPAPHASPIRLSLTPSRVQATPSGGSGPAGWRPPSRRRWRRRRPGRGEGTRGRRWERPVGHRTNPQLTQPGSYLRCSVHSSTGPSKALRRDWFRSGPLQRIRVRLLRRVQGRVWAVQTIVQG